MLKFPEPPDLKLSFDKLVGDGNNLVFSHYGPQNPHPGFGTDPNILNEYGHTKYPMFVGSVIVNNQEEHGLLLRSKTSVPTSIPDPVVENKPSKDWK